MPKLKSYLLALNEEMGLIFVVMVLINMVSYAKVSLGEFNAYFFIIPFILLILLLIILICYNYVLFVNKENLHDILYTSFKDNHPNEYQDRYIRYALDNNNNCLQITRITEGKHITSDTKILPRECFDDSLETFTGGGYSIKTQVNVDTIFSDLWNSKQTLSFTRYLKFWKPISLTELFSNNDLATFGYKSI